MGIDKSNDEKVGIASPNKIRGMAKYLEVEHNMAQNGGRTVKTIYVYRIPRELLDKALAAGAIQQEGIFG